MGSHAAPNVIHEKKSFPKRELVAHKDVVLTKSTWSEWECIIAPVKVDGWFARPDNLTAPATILSVDKLALPTKKIGVYEIAISPPFDHDQIQCIYVGRAISTKKSSTSVRTRLCRYIHDGFDFHIELRYYLELGCRIYARWAFLPSLQECVAQELVFLSRYNYVCNTANNAPVRKPMHTLWKVAEGRYGLLPALIKEKVLRTDREQLLELVRSESTDDECSEMLASEKKRREAALKKK
jgi:hypothetical protein